MTKMKKQKGGMRDPTDYIDDDDDYESYNSLQKEKYEKYLRVSTNLDAKKDIYFAKEYIELLNSYIENFFFTESKKYVDKMINELTKKIEKNNDYTVKITELGDIYEYPGRILLNVSVPSNGMSLGDRKKFQSIIQKILINDRSILPIRMYEDYSKSKKYAYNFICIIGDFTVKSAHFFDK